MGAPERRSFRAARPVIGITTYLEAVPWGSLRLDTVLIPYTYVEAIERAGGTPLLVPPVEEGVAEMLDPLDGLLLSGGADLDPASYGAAPHPATTGTRPARDRAELALLDGAFERDLPVLGICRGSQVLNVARGGDLIQHLPDVVGDATHTLGDVFTEHPLRIEDDSLLGSLLTESAPVKSSHHQGFGRLGKGLREVAWADDGTIEAIEDPDRRFTIGVLWHPEAGEDTRLFAGLVAEAARYRLHALRDVIVTS